MSDLIDRKKAIEAIKQFKYTDRFFKSYAVDILNGQPTVDAESVRHGKWKEYDDDYGDTYECTSCGELFCMIEGTPIENGYDYCPKCGAKMDEVERRMSKWIPVTEKLPETSRCKYILVTLYCPALNFKSVEPAYYINEKFYRLETARSFDDEIDEVIAWMPLPKPYERKEE